MTGAFKKGYRYITYHGVFRAAYYLLRLMILQAHRLFARNGYVIKRVNDSYSMYLDPKDMGISQALYLYGAREGDQVYIVRGAVKENMKVLDIGANIGYYALLEAGLVGAGGRVYAFEPHPGNFRTLMMNIGLNGFSDRIEAHEAGMSDREGSAEFFVSPKSNLHTLNPLASKPDAGKDIYDGSIKIKIADVAAFLLDKKDIDMIRMDIEGHEVEVLKGIRRALEGLEVFPLILFETHFRKYDGQGRDIRDALEGLFDRGYGVENIVSDRDEKSPLKKMGYSPERVIKTDRVERGLYGSIPNDDAARCICETGGIRAVFLKDKRN